MTPPDQVKQLIELHSFCIHTSGGAARVELPNIRQILAVYFRISPDYISRFKLISNDMCLRTDIPGTLLDCEVIGRHIYSVWRFPSPIVTSMYGSQAVAIEFQNQAELVPSLMNVILEFERLDLLELPAQPVTQRPNWREQLRSGLAGTFGRKAP